MRHGDADSQVAILAHLPVPIDGIRRGIAVGDGGDSRGVVVPEKLAESAGSILFGGLLAGGLDLYIASHAAENPCRLSAGRVLLAVAWAAVGHLEVGVHSAHLEGHAVQ